MGREPTVAQGWSTDTPAWSTADSPRREAACASSVRHAFWRRRTDWLESAGYFQNHVGGSFCGAADLAKAGFTADFGEPLFAGLSAKAETYVLGQ